MEETLAVRKEKQSLFCSRHQARYLHKCWFIEASQQPRNSLIVPIFVFYFWENWGSWRPRSQRYKIESRFKPSCPYSSSRSHTLFHYTHLFEYKLVSISSLINQIVLVDESDLYDCLNFCLNFFYNWEIPVNICHFQESQCSNSYFLLFREANFKAWRNFQKLALKK